MAGTTVKATITGMPGSDVEAIRLQFNKLIDNLETFRAVMSAGGVVAVTELMADHATFVTVVDDLKTLANSLRTYLNDGLLVHGALAISATAEDFKTTATAVYTISGVTYTKAATDNLSFSAADTINTGAAAGSFWGIWLVQIDAAGTISTKSPSADQTYASEAAAIAALPAVDAGNVALGYITVNANNDSAWTANTDDLTPTSDCADANFSNTAIKTLPSAVSSSPPATLSAAVPSATAIDEAADITAAKAADLAGNTT